MRILITGANGFIGGHLAGALQGHELWGFVLPGTPLEPLEGLKIKLLEVDIRDRERVFDAFKEVRPHLVFHLAAVLGDFSDEKLFRDVNVLGLENVLDGAVSVGTGRFVFLSSLAAHGLGPYVDADETLPLSANYPDYAVSKRIGEELVMEYHHLTGMEVVIVRPGLMPFGPRDMLFTHPMLALLKAGVMPLIDGGRGRINPAFVGNLVDGIIQTGLAQNAANETFVIADPPVTTREFFGTLAKALGVSPRPISLPSRPLKALAVLLESVPGIRKPPITRYRLAVGGRDFFFSTSKAERLLGYRPRWNLEEAADITVAWFRRQGLV